MKKISSIIFDWAGTTVDYGCFAPVEAFSGAFQAFGLTPTLEETRAPMGLPKRDHIEQMVKGERLSALWKEQHGQACTQEDIDRIYRAFEPALFQVLRHYTDPLPGVLKTVEELREMGISIGSTTGYTRGMMDVVASAAAEKGYRPDCLICPDDTGGVGRPAPYMIWRNLEKLKVTSIAEVLKVGDTTADMWEGKNAGCLCVGVIRGSSMLGISWAELEQKTAQEKERIFAAAADRFRAAGADYVIESIAALPDLVRSI